MNTDHTHPSAGAQPLTSGDDTEDLHLQVYRDVADALRQAYQFNKEAERYHLRGASSAALHQVSLAGRHVHRAQARLRLLAIEQEHKPAAASTFGPRAAEAPPHEPVWQT